MDNKKGLHQLLFPHLLALVIQVGKVCLDPAPPITNHIFETINESQGATQSCVTVFVLSQPINYVNKFPLIYFEPEHFHNSTGWEGQAIRLNKVSPQTGCRFLFLEQFKDGIVGGTVKALALPLTLPARICLAPRETCCVPNIKQLLQDPQPFLWKCIAQGIFGEGRKAYLESDASITAAEILRVKPNCEQGTFQATILQKKECTWSEVIVRIMAKKLNITFSHEEAVIESYTLIDEDMEDSFHEEDTLVLCVEKCFMNEDSWDDGRSSIVLVEKTRYYALYCTYAETNKYIHPSLTILLKPFDYYIWSCLCAVAVAVALLYGNVGKGLDIFLQLAGQQGLEMGGNREGEHFKLLQGILLLVLFQLNQEYQCAETLKLSAPLPMQSIKSARVLFESGYRTVLPDEETARFGSSLVADRYKKLGIPKVVNGHPNTVISREMNINLGLQWWYFNLMAKNNWVTFVGGMDYDKSVRSGLNNRILNTTCFAVRDPVGEDDQHLFQREYYYMSRSSRGWLGRKAYGVMGHLVSAGLFVKWREIVMNYETRNSGLFKACHEGTCGEDDSYEPLKFHSSFQALLMWYGILGGGCWICFLVEIGVIQRINRRTRLEFLI